MTKQKSDTQGVAQIEPFVITRIFDAPRDLVFKVWTESKHLKNWFTPKGFTLTVCKVDLRPGGITHYCMEGPNNLEMWGKAVYREIVAPERIIYLQSFSDKDLNITRHPMSPTWPREMLTTITFKDLKGRTEIKIGWIPINATAEEIKTFDASRDGMKGGWTGTFEQLSEYLKTL